ncbi:MAG TPA: M1 family metallopeptidase, partial [Patescibacteria group bacterium]|nr:M1 family metallopeptidase [Patescibacteria group bacterium]
MGAKIHHLVRQFKPEIYNLTLDIDKVKMTFRGEVEIEGIKIGRPSKKIVFHQKELKILSAVIIQNGREKKHIEVNRINIHKSYDEVRLHADELMRPGKYTIKLEFKGQISKSMHGIYPCFYKHNSLEKTLIATQFESHHAREAFPCIDEPEAKSVFNLSIIGPKNEIVISNTPINKSVVKADRKTTIFEPSPIMSSYLLAFVIGELHCISGKSKNGVEVNSWANISQPINQLGYANKEAINVLDFFIDYFKTPYPLKKLDQVALPDFDSLAMENWGLITYREVGLLTDPKNRSISSEQLITLVISHEISHQWFGNLVTMKWWDDLWLNESFASLMENIAPDRLHPDWNQWEDFTTGRVLSCSHRDIYKDVQSVGVKVKHPDEIMSLFDPAIVYAKGSRILSMLFEYIGEGDFREGLKVYFKDHAFKNTTRDDLWRSLSSISKKDIGKLMTPWIEQSGQPELSVEFNSSKAHLEQERFLVDGQDKVSIWPIPLLSQPPTKVDILEKKQADIEINGEKPIFNINGSGHYLVKYKDEAMLSDIKSKIIGRNVSSISR